MKYKLKDSLITPLTDAGYIDGGGEIQLRLPWQEEGEAERMFHMTWLASTVALQTSNSRAMVATKETASPPIKINDVWKVVDPSITWFDVLPDADPVTAKVINDIDGVEVLARWERQIVSSYCRDTETAKPDLFQPKSTLQPILTDALSYYGRTP